MMHNIDEGLAASRPAAYLGNSGLFYIATDTQAVSVSDGTQWIDLGGGGGGGALSIGNRVEQSGTYLTSIDADNTSSFYFSANAGNLSTTITNPNASNDLWVSGSVGSGILQVTNGGYADYFGWEVTVNSSGAQYIGFEVAEGSVADSVALGDPTVLNIPSLVLEFGFLLPAATAIPVAFQPTIRLVDDGTGATFAAGAFNNSFIQYVGVPVT